MFGVYRSSTVPVDVLFLSVKEICPPFGPLLLLLFHPDYTTAFHLQWESAAFRHCRKYHRVSSVCECAVPPHEGATISGLYFVSLYSVDAPAVQLATSAYQLQLAYKQYERATRPENIKCRNV